MSLDVYLKTGVQEIAGQRIFVREDGQTKEISREEWDRRCPDREPVTVDCQSDDAAYHRNITHNLNTMAGEAGIYQHLWRPDEIGVTHARQLIEPLRAGLELLRSDRQRFEAFNPANGWGSYDGLVEFVAEYLAACEEHPDAEVEVSR